MPPNDSLGSAIRAEGVSIQTQVRVKAPSSSSLHENTSSRYEQKYRSSVVPKVDKALGDRCLVRMGVNALKVVVPNKSKLSSHRETVQQG